VNTGAIDPLEELAEIARAEGLWFHADGAYGGLASMVPEVKPLFAGVDPYNYYVDRNSDDNVKDVTAS